MGYNSRSKEGDRQKMIAILAEKPDVAKKIAAALGGIRDGKDVIPFEKLTANGKKVSALMSRDGYLVTEFRGVPCHVTWALGHLCGLKDAQDYDPSYKSWTRLPKPFLPSHYEIKPSGKDAPARLRSIKAVFEKADGIICATDDDREGELIFSYIYEYTGSKKPVWRACFSSMTKEGFLDAFSNLKEGIDRKPIEAAGRMRAIADWVAGINLTVGMTVQNPKEGVVHVGRVQTPTLKIVVDREKEIRSFKPEPFWKIRAEFTTASGETYPAEHETERFKTEQEANAELDRLLREKEKALVESVESKFTKRGAPQLYSLSALQMDANARYGMTLKQTLSAAESLYTKGYTTYPRTTSRYLTEDMLPAVRKALGSLCGMDEYRELIENGRMPGKSKYWFDNSKVDSHFAIIPTGQIPKSLSPQEQKIFDLIARSLIRMMYGPAELKETSVTTVCAGSRFRSKGIEIVSPGWLVVGGSQKETVLPSLSVGEAVTGAFTLERSETKPPVRYTDKTLLSAMITAGKLVDDEELRKILDDPKVNGIGTSATRDSIIESLIQHGYMTRSGKTFEATDKGIALIDSLPVEAVKSPEMTAVWEKRLAEIADGTERPEVFRKDIEQAVTEWCGTIMEKPRGFLKTPAPKMPEGLSCPVCGKPLASLPWGVQCGACGFSVGTVCGKRLAPEEVADLVSKHRTKLIRGFKSKSGKKFDAWLTWNPEEKKIGFEFPKKNFRRSYRKRKPAGGS